MSPPLQEARPLLNAGPTSSDQDGDLEEGSTVKRLSLSPPPHEKAKPPGQPFNWRAPWGDRAPPEWAVLVLGCTIGLCSGASVVLFNLTVHGIHHVAWAGTPTTGAAWLRMQHLSDTWHRIMLIPVCGGVVVGMLHGVLGIIENISPGVGHSHGLADKLNPVAAVKPVIKAIQAAVTLGTGSSLGPEGPSVDIGKAWASGLADILKNSRQNKIALVAAGAAAGLAAGFNAAIAGCFFAVETVLRPASGEAAPTLTISIVMMASVLSSTVARVFLGEAPAFTVPEYELRSAAELPLHLLLGVLCGIVAYILLRLIAYSQEMFDFLRDRLGVPKEVTPALGGLLVGSIALKYPGVLYWGFENVDEILHSRTSPTAPGPRLLLQLVFAKIIATSLCKGSGLVGGIYAPSLFLGAALGSAYGAIAGGFIDFAIPGPSEVAAPQAYALVGMAAMLAGVCQVPMTSVLLLFELTQDYRIMLPLSGAVGLSAWVASTAMKKEEKPKAHVSPRGRGRGISGDRGVVAAEAYAGAKADGKARGGKPLRKGRSSVGDQGLELIQLPTGEVFTEDELMDDLRVSQAMMTKMVTVSANVTVREAVGAILGGLQRCCLVVDEDNLLEGIMTLTDLELEAQRAAQAVARGEMAPLDVDSMLVACVCTGKRDGETGEEMDLVTIFPDMSLKQAWRLMQPRGLQQLPVVARGGKRWQERGRKLVGLLDRDCIKRACRAEATKRALDALKQQEQKEDDQPLNLGGH